MTSSQRISIEICFTEKEEMRIESERNRGCAKRPPRRGSAQWERAKRSQSVAEPHRIVGVAARQAGEGLWACGAADLHDVGKQMLKKIIVGVTVSRLWVSCAMEVMIVMLHCVMGVVCGAQFLWRVSLVCLVRSRGGQGWLSLCTRRNKI